MNEYSDAVKIADNYAQTLAIQHIQMQNASFENALSPEDALVRGTIFPELYLPFCAERGVK